MKAAVKKLTSIVIMLIFTAFGFVVLAFSIVLMAGESLLSAVLPQDAATNNSDEDATASRMNVKSKYSPTTSRDAS